MSPDQLPGDSVSTAPNARWPEMTGRTVLNGRTGGIVTTAVGADTSRSARAISIGRDLLNADRVSRIR